MSVGLNRLAQVLNLPSGVLQYMSQNNFIYDVKVLMRQPL